MHMIENRVNRFKHLICLRAPKYLSSALKLFPRLEKSYHPHGSLLQAYLADHCTGSASPASLSSSRFLPFGGYTLKWTYSRWNAGRECRSKQFFRFLWIKRKRGLLSRVIARVQR